MISLPILTSQSCRKMNASSHYLHYLLNDKTVTTVIIIPEFFLTNIVNYRNFKETFPTISYDLRCLSVSAKNWSWFFTKSKDFSQNGVRIFSVMYLQYCISSTKIDSTIVNFVIFIPIFRFFIILTIHRAENLLILRASKNCKLFIASKFFKFFDA